ncbi:MAG TPA: phosphatidate cytidylyltransferase [Ktedonobacterales bacterium]
MADHAPDASVAAAEQARAGAAREWWSSLGRRTATAFALIPVVVALVWFGGWVAFAGATLTLLLALFELRAMLAQRGWHLVFLLSLAFGVDFLLAAMLPQQRAALLQIGITATLAGAFTWLILTRRATLENSLTDWALTLALPVYLGWPLSLFLAMRGAVAGYKPAGFWWVLTTLFCVWAFDTFALLGGRVWGRTKLAPWISPKKTWEGAAVGLVFALIAGFVFTRPLGIAWYHGLAIGAVVSVAATIGDLAESLLKRDTGVKDSGSIVPGHGGILDRTDSLLFGAMAVFFYGVALGAFSL